MINNKSVLTLLLTMLFSSTTSAALILETYSHGDSLPDTIGGYSMTNFDVMNDTLSGGTSTVNSPLGGKITFKRQNGKDLQMTRALADSTSWWNNSESADYDIFTTSVPWVELVMPENTRAFSFNVGADLSSTGINAWLVANESLGNGIGKSRFNVNRNNTPGFGIYADNAASGECSAITSVIIDPDYWGLGNFSINQDDCAVGVPEPSTVVLMGMGLIGMVLIRRREKNHSSLIC